MTIFSSRQGAIRVSDIRYPLDTLHFFTKVCTKVIIFSPRQGVVRMSDIRYPLDTLHFFTKVCTKVIIFQSQEGSDPKVRDSPSVEHTSFLCTKVSIFQSQEGRDPFPGHRSQKTVCSEQCSSLLKCVLR